MRRGFFLTWKSLIFMSPSSKTWSQRSQSCYPKAISHFQQPKASSHAPTSLLYIFPSGQKFYTCLAVPGGARIPPSGRSLIKKFSKLALELQSTRSPCPAQGAALRSHRPSGRHILSLGKVPAPLPVPLLPPWWVLLCEASFLEVLTRLGTKDTWITMLYHFLLHQLCAASEC